MSVCYTFTVLNYSTMPGIHQPGPENEVYDDGIYVGATDLALTPQQFDTVCTSGLEATQGVELPGIYQPVEAVVRVFVKFGLEHQQWVGLTRDRIIEAIPGEPDEIEFTGVEDAVRFNIVEEREIDGQTVYFPTTQMIIAVAARQCRCVQEWPVENRVRGALGLAAGIDMQRMPSS